MERKQKIHKRNIIDILLQKYQIQHHWHYLSFANNTGITLIFFAQEVP